MVYSFNRILIGFFILSILLITYLYSLEKIFFILISISIFYELKISNLINFKNLLFLLPLFLICFFLFNAINFSIIYINISLFLLILFTILFKKLIKFFFLFIIIIFLINFFISLNLENNFFYILLFVCFINDTSAYIIGRSIKGPLILPSISPNKTWSGTVSSFLITFCILIFLEFNVFASFFLAISLFFGDLYFSFIKRHLKIKDFSKMLSSHGGMLDRFDSLFLFFVIYNFI